jgi:hypothetical protein
MPPERVHIPEVIEPDEKLPADLVALRKFARLLDEAFVIPGTNRRIGLDAGLGLIPGVGDIVGGVLSAAVVIGALRHRVPGHVIVRMVINVLGDLLVGAIPVLGDVADFFFEQNVINMKLLLKHRDRSRPPRSTKKIFFIASLIVLLILSFAIALAIAVMSLIVWMMRS